jgi:hypothetical protein
VYRLHDRAGAQHALKVFKKKYRTEAVRRACDELRHFAQMPGMKAAQRDVILPGSSDAQRCEPLGYSVLMPWVAGSTWFDVLSAAQLTTQKGKKLRPYLPVAGALRASKSLLSVLGNLEQIGAAHTDVAPGNVVLELKYTSIQLLDLEDMYTPRTRTGEGVGSPGYQHRSRQSVHCPEGDRYAAAVMSAEMLLLADGDFARLASDEGFFGNNHSDTEAQTRYAAARQWLDHVAPQFSALFDRAWNSRSLSECPGVRQLLEAMPVASPMDVTEVKTSRSTRRSPSPPPERIGKDVIQWEAWGDTQVHLASPETTEDVPSRESKRSLGFLWALLLVIAAVLLLTILGNN